METMVTVINAFRAGAVPDAPTNPYEREFIRQGKAAEFDTSRWDATVQPNEYTPIPTPAARLLGDLPMMIIPWVVVTVVIGLLAEFFLN
jgi:hypothetical protein